MFATKPDCQVSYLVQAGFPVFGKGVKIIRKFDDATGQKKTMKYMAFTGN